MRPDEGHRKRCTGLLLLAWMTLMVAPALAQPSPGAFGPMSMPQIEFVKPRPLNTVVAKTKSGPLTIADLITYSHSNRIQEMPQVPMEKIPALPDEQLLKLAQWIASRQAAAAAAQTDKSELATQAVKMDMTMAEDTLIIQHLVRTEILDKVTSPTQQEIEATYVKHKPEFKAPFRFKMRHLIRMTYEPYVVKEGDTLESIAKTISGDPAQAESIRADVPERPLRREQDKVFKALQPGEKLLVPMSKEKAAEVRQQLETLLKQLDKGVPFKELVKQNSEADTKDDPEERLDWLPTGTKPMLPQILQAAKNTPKGKVSAIFQTKHGFQVIEVVDKEEERMLTLPEVRQNIVTNLRKERMSAQTDAFMNKIYGTPKLKINYELIAQGDKLTTGTTVATLGADKIGWNNEIKTAWESTGRPTTEPLIDAMLHKVPTFYRPLSREYVRPLLDNPESGLARQIKTMRIGNIGSAYMGGIVTEQIKKELTPERVKAYYEANKEQFKTPTLVQFSTMERDLEEKDLALKGAERDKALEELRKQMEQDLANVKTMEQFLDVAAQVNATLKTTPLKTEKPTPIQGMPPELADRLKKLTVGKWTEPFITNDKQRVVSILLREKTKEDYLPMDKAINQINRSLFMKQLDETSKQVEADFLKQSGFEFALKSEGKSQG